MPLHIYQLLHRYIVAACILSISQFQFRSCNALQLRRASIGYARLRAYLDELVGVAGGGARLTVRLSTVTLSVGLFTLLR